jgi:ferredoxin
MRRRRSAELARLRVDPVLCDGIGICAHLAPELVRVDSWGYPIVPLESLDERDQKQAQRAVRGCPRKALFLDPVPATLPIR